MARHFIVALVVTGGGLMHHAGAANVVGRIGGSFDSTATGAATYTIPIQVAAGMNGLKPAIALSYNSQAGDGLAGAGWTLSGFSEITRCPLTRAVDGRVQGVRFTGQDRFCLDGHPLILLSGAYGAAGAQYRPEMHSYQRVTSYGQQGTGPAWFEIVGADGLVYRYGNDADSRVEAPGTSEVRAWALNEIEDKFQQRIGFAWAEDGVSGEHWPTEIRWTWGAAETFQQARYRLSMSWEPRPADDVREGYVWASPWRTSQRLTVIDYEFNAGSGFTRLHRYSLGYAAPATNGRPGSRLASITQCGPTQCLPATTVYWDEPSAERTTEAFTTIPVEKSVFGDFNGDGATDVFGGYQGLWAVWPANPQAGGFLQPIAIPAVFNDSSVGIPLDYNGDGLMDLMTGSAQGTNWAVNVAPTPPATAFQSRATTVSWTATTAVEAMDIDGDGLDDIVYLRNGTLYVRRNTGGALAAEQASGIGPVPAPNIANAGNFGFLERADFDGDGRADVLLTRSSEPGGVANYRWEAFLSIGSGFARDPIATFTTPPAPGNVIVLDMNGDGLTDVLRYADGAWRPYVSRGTAAGSTPGLVQSSCPSPVSQSGTDFATPLDYDNDGRSDLMMHRGFFWRIYHPDGSCFSSTDHYTDLAQPAPSGFVRAVPVDSDGDGNTDLMFGSNSQKRWILSRTAPQTRPDGVTIARRSDLVRQVTDGLGNAHELFYRPLSGWSGYQASGTSPAMTRLLRGGPLYVLSQYTTNTGSGPGQYNVSFGYVNARMDTQGRGLLGFQTVRTTDSRSGLITETTYRQDFPFAGRADKVTVWNGVNKVSVYDPAWSVASISAPDPALDTHFVHLTADLREAYEVDGDGSYLGSLVRSSRRSLTWDYGHGAVTTEQTTVSSPQQPGTTYHTTRTMSLDESLRSSAGCLGFPTRIDVTRDISGNGAQTRTVLINYNVANCRIASRIEGPPGSPAQQLRTSFTYDTQGRILSITRADEAGTLPQRQTRLAYDAVGFRPVAESQVIGGEPDLVVTHGWNDGLGLETSRTSAQGLTTAWRYDEFGRVLVESRPGGASVTSYAGCGPCFTPSARYAIRQSRSDGYWTESQHDSFGRIVGRAFVLPDGRASRQVLEFDALGRLARESVPYAEDAASVYWTRYTYDLSGRPKIIDRPLSETAPSGAITSLAYGGLTTTIRDAESRATSYTYDAEGRIMLVQPPLGGAAAYTYDASGQLNSVLDAGWNNRQFAYDERGLLAQSTDPDAGRRSFTYNAFGELLSITDGKSPSGTMILKYDQLGRVTRRIEPEGSTIWTYFTTVGPARARLQQVTGPTDGSAAGFQESYVYDTLGRLQRATAVIDGSSYPTDYAYAAEDKLVSMTFPTTVGWRPKFVFSYSNGHLASIAQDALTLTPVYTLLAMDAQGHEAAARYGNGALEQRNVYDDASARLSAIRSGTPASPVALQNYSYEWDRIGNLLARQDLASSPQLHERFAYDSLNRLSQATLNGAPTLTMAYSQDGNILSKSDVGNYGYGTSGQQPHAVSSISGGPRGVMTFAYDANGNMTTRNGASITWTSFNLPKQVNAGSDYARFTYGPGRGRVRQDIRSGAATRTIHYVGPHFEAEIEGSVRRYRANVFAYGHAVYSQLETTPNGLEAYYVLHDHQGSVDRLVRAAGAGKDTLALSYDAWGKRRNANWTADTTDQRYADSHWVERGYTGHEHLDGVRLINMNGRLEDPMLARMLTPDPVMGSLMSPQTLNPYSYVANDPTSYFDPSGYFLNSLWNGIKRAINSIGSFFHRLVQNWGREIVAIVAAYYTAGAASSWAYGTEMSSISVSLGSPALVSGEGITAAGTLTAAVPTGVVVGGIAGGAVAGAISSGTVKGAAYGALTGGITAGISGYYGGTYAAGRVLAEASVGGASAELQGGDFSHGFLISGGMSSLTWASLEMRRAMIEQSRLRRANETGISEGFQDDLFKLGGCRSPCQNSPLGGVQGGPGKLFGMPYDPGSFTDHLIETFAGPHDFLNAPFFYDAMGENIGRPRIMGIINAGNVLVAAPFAAASAIPSFAYQVLD